MNAVTAMNSETGNNDRYARCIEVSKRIRWEIEQDVIRSRDFDYSKPFLPNGLSKVEELDFLGAAEKKFLSQVQGRSYAYIFGLVERFINAKVLEISQKHWFGDQTKLEALVRFSDEELKHQAMFRRLEEMMDANMPTGYQLTADPDGVAHAVLSKSTWAVMMLTLHIEMFTQLHYKESIDKAEDIDPLWKDVFLFHWKEESQHAILDELELRELDATLTTAERDQAVTDFIDLVVAVDGVLQAQANADAQYFIENCGRALSDEEQAAIAPAVFAAYRWQYIFSGAQSERFLSALTSMVNDEQAGRIVAALGTLA